LKNLKQYASFDKTDPAEDSKSTKSEISIQKPPGPATPLQHGSQTLGLNLAYTINLNLPATSDQAVFNAIFKSLKENLLSEE
jgi:hypothetical protein